MTHPERPRERSRCGQLELRGRAFLASYSVRWPLLQLLGPASSIILPVHVAVAVCAGLCSPLKGSL